MNRDTKRKTAGPLRPTGLVDDLKDVAVVILK